MDYMDIFNLVKPTESAQAIWVRTPQNLTN